MATLSCDPVMEAVPCLSQLWEILHVQCTAELGKRGTVICSNYFCGSDNEDDKEDDNNFLNRIES